MNRNSQKRIYGDNIYFITCAVHDKIEFFKESQLCELWIQEIKLCKELKQFLLIAFCLIYDHFHLLIKPNNEIANYSKIMHFLKRNFSQNANKILGYVRLNDEGDNAPEGDNAHCLQWQIKMDNFVIQTRNKFLEKHGKYHNLPKFKWQKSFHDHIIRNQKDLANHWNYTMNNFLKHGLPENWQYTGLNYPELIDEID
ncbi:MAG: transposase [Candidatus Cloacimonetes bacterium]|nr:transposase [Candidatus Cloacimonadota bacterium]MCF7815173.1 transposase [Candidatus Cloacimonadota bacterium]MCF7867699.1 transposase [Candidatus Cloacimonadota bacterium]